MITLSENARKELEAYFADKERQTIRVYLAPGGCSGPRLVLALDEPGDEDARFEQDGFAFCINKELLQQVKSVSIDLSYHRDPRSAPAFVGRQFLRRLLRQLRQSSVVPVRWGRLSRPGWFCHNRRSRLLFPSTAVTGGEGLLPQGIGPGS